MDKNVLEYLDNFQRDYDMGYGFSLSFAFYEKRGLPNKLIIAANCYNDVKSIRLLRKLSLNGNLDVSNIDRSVGEIKQEALNYIENNHYEI